VTVGNLKCPTKIKICGSRGNGGLRKAGHLNIGQMIRANTFSDITEALSDGGVIAQSYVGFEARPEQVKMALAVGEVLSKPGRLAVEAGTGVGKSFAYLVPVIDMVCRGGPRVLVSTYTITLQEQLINKDLPFLAGCIPHNFSAVLAKGRGNYICRRRLEFARRRQRGLFDQYSTILDELKRWSEETEDGSLSDIPFMPPGNMWDQVKSEHGNCRGRKCEFFDDCLYWRARHRLESADIVVTNHALMFSDLVLKERGAGVLPDYDYVVVDEAHNVEHVAEDHFGINISNNQVKYLLDGLYNVRTGRGLVSYLKAEELVGVVERVRQASREFFERVRNWYAQNEGQTRGRCGRNFVEDNLSGYINELTEGLAKAGKGREDADEKFELRRFIDRCDGLREQLGAFMTQKEPEQVYWIESGSGRRETIRLRSAPVNVGPYVKEALFERFRSVVLTSATLSTTGTDKRGGFEFFANRIGLVDYKELKVGSPFDYQRQVKLYIESKLANPNDPKFTDEAAKVIEKYLLKTSGRAFVLFTSYLMLNEVADKMAGWLGSNDIELLQQGAGVDRGKLLEIFKESERAVLFGTDSFWQGVDVPGEALSNVIIVRLPFAVPDQPLLAGRLKQIKEKGGNPFFDYQLPSAIIKFKQGFGRLIRSKSDEGIVVVLDSRICSRRYGQRFLAAVPKCRTEIV